MEKMANQSTRNAKVIPVNETIRAKMIIYCGHFAWDPEFLLRKKNIMSTRNSMVLITREKAREWLDNMSINRPVKRGQVLSLARAIDLDRYDPKVRRVKFDVNGQMIDGQHLCLAVLESKTGKVWCAIVTGLSLRAAQLLDINEKRSAHDQMIIAGHEIEKKTSNLLSWVWNFDCGSAGGRKSSTIPRPGVEDLEATLEKYPEIIKVGNIVADHPEWKTAGVAEIQVAMFAFFRLYQRDTKKSFQFMNMLMNGENLKSGSPVLAVRQRLLGMRNKGARVDRSNALRLIIRAWNQ